MPFTAEITFTGFGYMLLHSRRRRDPAPAKAQIMLLKNDPHFPYHWSNLSFRLEDLRRPEGEIFAKTNSGPDGSTIAKLNLLKQVVEIKVEADDEPEFAIDWDGSVASGLDLAGSAPLDHIARIDEDLGIDDLIPPGKDFGGGPYTGRVILPKGHIFARRELRDPEGNPTLFRFGGDAARVSPLAEQIVWRRPGVRSLILEVQGGDRFVLDSSTRESWGEAACVQLAITNLPKEATSGTDWEPRDLDMFMLGSRSRSVATVERLHPIPLPVTPHSACPPALREIVF